MQKANSWIGVERREDVNVDREEGRKGKEGGWIRVNGEGKGYRGKGRTRQVIGERTGVER